MCRTIPQGASVYSGLRAVSQLSIAEGQDTCAQTHDGEDCANGEISTMDIHLTSRVCEPRSAKRRSIRHTIIVALLKDSCRKSGPPAGSGRLLRPPSCLLLPSSKAQERRDSYLENGGGYSRRAPKRLGTAVGRRPDQMACNEAYHQSGITLDGML
jgi:hypothetical protein